MSDRPSITCWNRLEPSPRANDVVGPLAARVRDPLWLLLRQWQLWEFHGEDGGCPAWLEADTTTERLSDRMLGERLLPLDPSAPLETLLREPRSIDLATSVELGQLFESLLASRGLIALTAKMRAAFPVATAVAGEEELGDEELLRFRSVVGGRALDGAALDAAVRKGISFASIVPDAERSTRAALSTALRDYTAVVDDLLGPDAPSAWSAERLAYELELLIRGSGARFTSRPTRTAEVTWETLSADKPPLAGASVVPERDVVTMLPASVRFRGSPPVRWWDFDDASIDFGAIDVERRDLGKLMATDAILQHGVDWYVIPLDQLAGSSLHIDAVLVRDVFGVFTLIPPAADTAGRWSLFTVGGNFASGDHLLSSTAAPLIQHGAPLEQVRFVRDDMLNMFWAVEETVEGALGQPLSGFDRASRRRAAAPPPAAGPTPFAYHLHGDIPEPWSPFVLVARGGLVKAERLALTEPAGRMLRESNPYRVGEEELRRSGLRVSRVAARCRGTRGETYLWTTRTKDVGARNDAPLPRFDALVAREVAAAGEQRFGQVSMIRSPFGARGNFELVVPLASGGLAHYWRDNDGAARAWHGPIVFAAGAGKVDAVSMIFSTFNNLELVARIGDRLAHFWRNSATQEWSDPDFFGSGVSGTPSFVQRRGDRGNFEVVAPFAAGGMAHFWRDNSASFGWSPPDLFAESEGDVADVSLVETSFDNLELVARIGDRLAYFWRNSSTLVWSPPTFFADGVGGTPSLIQSAFGTPGNFEVVAPLAAGGMAHFWRNNSDPALPWSPPLPFAGGAIGAASLIQTPDGYFHVAASTGIELLLHWREGAVPFIWHGPQVIDS